MSDKKTGSIADQVQEIIDKLIEQGETEDLELYRQIERANEKLKTPPKKDWVH